MSNRTNSAAAFDGSRRLLAQANGTRPEQDRQEYWRRAFEKDFKPELLHDLVADLITNKKFEDVISCLEQAILHGQIQPWMHQVLALAMQAAGRPKSQIERVLMSSQDLISNDPNSMMSLASHLVRFDRHEQAIELYRQAATIDPSRPEPYVLALELAARTKNYPAVVWSAPEVLTYSWNKEREKLNKLAEQTSAEAESAFIKSGDLVKAYEIRTAMQRARRLDLVIRLEWNGQGDIDLKVKEPGGSVCSVIKPMTAAGGVFIHDGFGPNQQQCYEEYLCPLGLPGEYQAVVSHITGNIVGKRARLVIVRDKGTPREETTTETVFLGSTDQTVRLSLTNGRRRVANAQPQVIDKQASSNAASLPPAYLAQLGNAGAVGQAGFVTGAVGFTPVVTTISEGVRMGAMATVSGDRRYVRISVEPIFSTITDVFTFTAVR